MKPYIDGYVLPVQKAKVKDYKKIAEEAGKIWMKHGALQYVEASGDDLNPKLKGATFTTFSQMVKTKQTETVIFAFITYKSKAHRDKVNAKVMKEMEKHAEKYKDMPMPFDMKRMAYGGFQSIVYKK